MKIEFLVLYSSVDPGWTFYERSKDLYLSSENTGNFATMKLFYYL